MYHFQVLRATRVPSPIHKSSEIHPSLQLCWNTRIYDVVGFTYSNCNLFCLPHTACIWVSPQVPSPQRTIDSYHISPTNHIILQPCFFCISLLSSYFPCSFLLFIICWVYYHIYLIFYDPIQTPVNNQDAWGQYLVTKKKKILILI